MASTDNNPPPILDPFAGGGTIPLEAQRLGLEAHASDLNPVAVLINKALIEIPPKFRDRPPVHPSLQSKLIEARGAEGLAADVRAYGQWMRDEAERRIGHFYPKADLPDGSKATVIAWIWARTVTCPNPACGIEMPLVRSWWLGKKKAKEAYVIPRVVGDPNHPSGLRVTFEIGHNPTKAPTTDTDGTMSGRTGATCVSCATAVSVNHVRSEAMAGRMGQALMSVVAEGNRQRVYCSPTEAQISAAEVNRPDDSVPGELADNPRWFSPPAYGLTRFEDLFTNRQLVALTTFSDLVLEARDRVLADASAYADAVATYLGLAVSRLTSTNSALCRWNSAPSKESVTDTFGRQAIPMVWDFAEGRPFTKGPCDLVWSAEWVAKALPWLPTKGIGDVRQGDAAAATFDNGISTDPPYYDNIGYSDLSDLFYVWQRRTLRTVHPTLLSTMLVPKAEELVANPYRHDGKDGAREFFEDGFRQVFARARGTARPELPITFYYAFKQSESGDDGTSSSGWETLLDGMILSRWCITATWPMRSERSGRMVSVGTNALASSIVLALRPRPEDAPTTDRRGFHPGTPCRVARRPPQAPAGRHRPGRPAAGGDRAGHGGLLALFGGARAGRFADDGPLGAGSDQRDPRRGPLRAGG